MLPRVTLTGMHLQGQLAALERRWGRPRLVRLSQEIAPAELELVRASVAKRRTHDVTFFILDGPCVVVIRKPFFPPGVYRVPSGGVRPDEPFEAGVRREAHEETGLTVALEAYLVRVEAVFTCRGQRQAWTSHVFRARSTGGQLAPRDTEEIAEARWVELDALQGPIRRALLDTGRGLFAYRVALTDAAVAQLRALR